MAEAVVRPPQRFYCHICSVEIQTVNTDFTCPLCSGGFIEELPAPTEQPQEDVEMTDANAMDDLDMIRSELATLLMSRNGGGRPPDATDPAVDDDSQGERFGLYEIRGGGRRNRRRQRLPNVDRFDNILLEILQTLSVGNETALGNASMFFMGNPGDYAWGREGIDTIVTQLLNQMDTSGPPPLSKDKIHEIPKVEIIQEQVDQKLQCSVCWEDFKLVEFVRKLPCLHVYHENCIVPWLELHGTCPICRKSLTPDGPDVTNSLRNAATAFIRNVSGDQTNTTTSDNATTSNNSNSMQANYPPSSSSSAASSSQPSTSDIQQAGENNNSGFRQRIGTHVGTLYAGSGGRNTSQQMEHQHGHPHNYIQPTSTVVSEQQILNLILDPSSGFNLNNSNIHDIGGSSNSSAASTISAAGPSTATAANENASNQNEQQNDTFKCDDGTIDFEID